MGEKFVTIVVEVSLPGWELCGDPVREGDTHERHSLLEPAAQGGPAPAEPVAVVTAHYQQLVLHQPGSQGRGEEAGDLGVDSGYLARQQPINQ